MSSEDERLADAWSACELGRSVTHEEHVRIALVLLRRHGRDDGSRLIEEATLRSARPEFLRSDLFGPPAWNASGL